MSELTKDDLLRASRYVETLDSVEWLAESMDDDKEMTDRAALRVLARFLKDLPDLLKAEIAK